MVYKLISVLNSFLSVKKIVLTCNIPEPELADLLAKEPKVIVISNDTPKGFGENHNAAFRYCDTGLFCVINPDVYLSSDPFPYLSRKLISCNLSMIAPVVTNVSGEVEDSFRDFPGVFTIAKKLFGISVFSPSAVELDSKLIYPEWLAGMFMVFNAEAYRMLKGFDEKFYLYCEDVDICLRMRKKGGVFAVSSEIRIVHDAQRASHKNIRFASWHIKSLFRLWAKYPLLALKR